MERFLSFHLKSESIYKLDSGIQVKDNPRKLHRDEQEAGDDIKRDQVIMAFIHPNEGTSDQSPSCQI